MAPVQVAGRSQSSVPGRHRDDVPPAVGRIVGRAGQLADGDPAETRLPWVDDRQLLVGGGLDHLGDPHDVGALVRA